MSSRDVPTLLLGTEALLGITRAPRARTVETQRRFEQPGALAAAFRESLAAGAAGLLVTPSPLVRESLRAIPEAPAWAVVPNIPRYVRDASERGLVGTALDRVRGAGPGTLLRIGATGFTHARGVLANDFIGLVPVLFELECASLAAPRLEAVILASTLTDLALAGGHRHLFEHLVAFVRRRFGVRAGFETHNLGHLLARFRVWGIAPDLVVGPVNPAGFMMKPDPIATLAELGAARFPVLAKELRAGGAHTLESGAAFARRHGATGVVADLVDLESGIEEIAPLRR
jgi:hypothetical protein